MSRRVATSCIFSILCLLGLGGCSSLERPATPQEMIEAQTRTYLTLTPEQVFTASEKMFKLADERDFQMIREKHRLKATRGISVLVIEGYLEN